MASRNVKHFGEDKKSHTKIKHAIFSKTLSTSLAIANSQCIKRPANYTYIDLFAGKGIFEDGSPGSPMIALDTFIKHSKTKNYFRKISMLNIEKDDSDYQSLKKVLHDKIDTDWDKDTCTGNLEIGTGNSSWEDFENALKSHLYKSSWGFIFADPFSTELDLKKLTDQIKQLSAVKDIMIFANFNTLSRQHGRKHENDVERVCSTIGISNDLLSLEEDFSEQFKAAFSSQLSFKDFAIGVAFPIEVKKNLITADYFYLILGTNSIKVADGFLEAYAEEMSRYRKGLVFNTLFADDNIIEFLKDKNDATLYELLNHLFNNFLSWKGCGSASEIPTIANTVAKINKMIDAKEIELECHEDLVYKRNDKSKGNKIGHIKNSAISHKRDTEAITLKYLPPSGQQAFAF